MALTLYCQNCGRSLDVSTVSGMLGACLGCGGLHWSNTVRETPKNDYALNANDRRLLKPLRIGTEDAA